MTANEMRSALREYCVLRSMTIDDLESMDEYSLRPLFKGLIGKSREAANACAGPQFVVNDADLNALAQRVKASIDTELTANDLAKLPIARLRDLAHQHDWSSYNLYESPADDAETLQAVTALKNAIQSATPTALCTLGLDTLNDWQRQVERAVQAVSATVRRPSSARNAVIDGGHDEFAGYDLNATVAE